MWVKIAMIICSVAFGGRLSCLFFDIEEKNSEKIINDIIWLVLLAICIVLDYIRIG